MYQLWYKGPIDPNNKGYEVWYGSGEYTANPNFEFTPTSEGDYFFYIYVKDADIPERVVVSNNFVKYITVGQKTVTVGGDVQVAILVNKERPYSIIDQSRHSEKAPYNIGCAYVYVYLKDSDGNIYRIEDEWYKMTYTIAGPGYLIDKYEYGGPAFTQKLEMYVKQSSKGYLYPAQIWMGEESGKITLNINIEGYEPLSYTIDYIAPDK